MKYFVVLTFVVETDLSEGQLEYAAYNGYMSFGDSEVKLDDNYKRPEGITVIEISEGDN